MLKAVSAATLLGLLVLTSPAHARAQQPEQQADPSAASAPGIYFAGTTGIVIGIGSAWPNVPYSDKQLSFGPTLLLTGSVGFPFKVYPGKGHLALQLDLGYAQASAHGEGDWVSYLRLPPDDPNQFGTVEADYSDVQLGASVLFASNDPSRSRDFHVGAGLSLHVLSGSERTEDHGDIFENRLSTESDSGTKIGVILFGGLDLWRSDRLALFGTLRFDYHPEDSGPTLGRIVSSSSGGTLGYIGGGTDRYWLSASIGVRFQKR